jgi:hypothetical protein
MSEPTEPSADTTDKSPEGTEPDWSEDDLKGADIHRDNLGGDG